MGAQHGITGSQRRLYTLVVEKEMHLFWSGSGFFGGPLETLDVFRGPPKDVFRFKIKNILRGPISDFEGMGNPKHDPKWFQTWPNRKFQQISHLLLSGSCVAQHCYKTVQTLQITLLQARTSKMQTGYKHQAATCCKIPEK